MVIKFHYFIGRYIECVCACARTRVSVVFTFESFPLTMKFKIEI